MAQFIERAIAQAALTILADGRLEAASQAYRPFINTVIGNEDEHPPIDHIVIKTDFNQHAFFYDGPVGMIRCMVRDDSGRQIAEYEDIFCDTFSPAAIAATMLYYCTKAFPRYDEYEVTVQFSLKIKISASHPEQACVKLKECDLPELAGISHETLFEDMEAKRVN